MARLLHIISPASSCTAFCAVAFWNTAVFPVTVPQVFVQAVALWMALQHSSSLFVRLITAPLSSPIFSGSASYPSLPPNTLQHSLSFRVCNCVLCILENAFHIAPRLKTRWKQKSCQCYPAVSRYLIHRRCSINLCWVNVLNGYGNRSITLHRSAPGSCGISTKSSRNFSLFLFLNPPN